MMGTTIIAGVSMGLLLERSFGESLFVSTIIALSSTTVAVNGLSTADQDSLFVRLCFLNVPPPRD